MYTATADNGSTVTVRTLTEAKEWARQLGTTANRVIVTTSTGQDKALYRRDGNGNGRRWYKASV